MDERDIAEFFDGECRREQGTQHAGYLTGGWPTAIADNRLRGEHAWVERALGRYLPTRQRCIDVGCGTGVWTEWLAGHFSEVEGIDLSGEMVERARVQLAEAGITNATTRQHNVLTPLAAGSYDLAFLGGVLMYLGDDILGEAIANLRDSLTPGGVLLARETTHRGKRRDRTEPRQPGLFSEPDEEQPPYYAIYRTVPELRGELEKHGLRVVKLRANRPYKYAQLTQTAIRYVNSALGGGLVRDHARAEQWAQRIHRWRHLSVVPYYMFMRATRIPAWSMENHWFVCVRR